MTADSVVTVTVGAMFEAGEGHFERLEAEITRALAKQLANFPWDLERLRLKIVLDDGNIYVRADDHRQRFVARLELERFMPGFAPLTVN